MFDLFVKIADKQGWDADTQIGVLIDYISRQQSDEAFETFLNEQVETENAQDGH